MIEDHDEDLPTPSRGPGTGSRPRRPRLAAVLAVLTLVALAGGLLVTLSLRGKESDRAAEAKDRIAAAAAAQHFTEVWNTFTPDDADAYVERVSPLLTTKFRTEFTSASSDVVSGIAQQQLSSTGTVLKDADGIPLVGIASIDPDSADVLVVSDAQRTSSQQQVLRHWRWQVHLLKVGGRWLVDSFDEV